MLTNHTLAPVTTQFGLGFALESDKNDYQSISSMGTFSWGGAFATSYWGDPKEKLVGIIYTNMIGQHKLNSFSAQEPHAVVFTLVDEQL